MTDFLWPPDLIPSMQTYRKVDTSAAHVSPLSGAIRTVSRTGTRYGCRIEIAPNKGVSRARAMAIVAAMRRSDRIWMPDFSTTAAGSFSAPELLTNNDFSDGTTGWTGQNGTLSVSDSVMRVIGSDGANNFALYQSPTVTQYAPHVLRGFIRTPISQLAQNGIYTAAAGDNTQTGGQGMFISGYVPLSATPGADYPAVFDNSGGNHIAGDYGECLWSSLSRCWQVDNGPNALLQSQTFQTTWTATRTTISADADTAPDGTATADRVVEDSSAATTHFISQSVTVASAAADFTFSVAVKAGTRSFGAIQLVEGSGATVTYAFFDLTDGSWDSEATGANWSNLRKHVVSLGNGWYRFTITARKTNSATSIDARIFMADAADSSSFNGDGSSYIRVWGASLAQSSVPVRYVATTTTATTGTSQTGSTLYLKGLPASTQGLGRMGDAVQVGNQINFLAARLDSDAAGRGVMQTTIPWIEAPSDSDPVIFNTPMALMKVVEDTGWDTGPGQFSPFVLDLIQV